MQKAFHFLVVFLFITISSFNVTAHIALLKTSPFQTNKIKCEIIKKGHDNRGLTNQLYVYVAKISDIKALNKILFDGYKNTGIVTLQIFYFDDKLIAKTYSTKVFDKNTSERELDRMGKHMIGKFEYTSFNNTQSLHIGKDSDMY